MNSPSLLTPDELARMRAERPETRLLDVRTPGEFEAQHIEGSYNVPLDTLHEHAAEIRAGVAGPVVLVCRSGQRGRKAEDVLRTAGMANLYVLDGGLSAWVAAKQPVREGRAKISLERQVRIVAGGLASVGAVLALLADPLFAAIPAVIGLGLVYAGATDTCAMAMLLSKLPYNRGASCDVQAMVRALTTDAAR